MSWAHSCMSTSYSGSHTLATTLLRSCLQFPSISVSSNQSSLDDAPRTRHAQSDEKLAKTLGAPPLPRSSCPAVVRGILIVAFVGGTRHAPWLLLSVTLIASAGMSRQHQCVCKSDSVTLSPVRAADDELGTTTSGCADQSAAPFTLHCRLRV